MMTTNELCNEIARREGKEKQVLSSAQAQEVIAILGDILAEMSPNSAEVLMEDIRNRGLARQDTK